MGHRKDWKSRINEVCEIFTGYYKTRSAMKCFHQATYDSDISEIGHHQYTYEV